MLGRQLEQLAWLPLPSDTPGVVEDLSKPSLSFTPCVELTFAPDLKVFLSWQAKAPCTLIACSADERWGAGILDRVQVAMGSDWANLIGSTLVQVDLFTCPEQWTMGAPPLNGAPVGVRHTLKGANKTHRFWVGTGGERDISEGDDLWLGLDVDPENVADLELVGSIG